MASSGLHVVVGFNLQFVVGLFHSNDDHDKLSFNVATPQEKELKDAGIPVPEGFSGTKKSYTLSPSNPETQSQIGVLPDPQDSCSEVKL